MTVRNRPAASEHIVQFFDTDESRARNVATFLAQGYAAEEPIVVIARPRNWTGILEHLERLGVPVTQAIADGKIVVMDAQETLRRIARNGPPTAAGFEQTVGASVAALAAGGRRLRAYGEMVDVLAQRGDLPDAIALEHLWNEMSTRVPLFLLCGYSAAHFVATGTHRALLDICKAHSDVHRHPQDPLAAWLLTAAYNGPGAGALLRH